MKISSIFFMVLLSCGRVYSLPQDWPCDKIVLTKMDKSFYSYKGDNGAYQIIIDDFEDNVGHPYLYNCGNTGCLGKMINIKTGQSEEMRFDCFWNNTENNLTCERISGDEYILNKTSDNEYRVELCGNFYKYILLNECQGCTCLLRDSRKTDYPGSYYMNCTSENEKQIHCYTEEAYNWLYKYENDAEDFEKCIGLRL